MRPTCARRFYLQKHYYFDCQCERCCSKDTAGDDRALGGFICNSKSKCAGAVIPNIDVAYMVKSYEATEGSAEAMVRGICHTIDAMAKGKGSEDDHFRCAVCGSSSFDSSKAAKLYIELQRTIMQGDVCAGQRNVKAAMRLYKEALKKGKSFVSTCMHALFDVSSCSISMQPNKKHIESTLYADERFRP